MPRRLLLIVGIALLLTGCAGAETENAKAAARTPTLVATPSVESLLGMSPSPATPTPPAEVKPGPPPGYKTPTPAPTSTVPSSVPSTDWKEIVLPPPEGIEQFVPADVFVPTVMLTIPEQWTYQRHPGAYFVYAGPPSSPLVLNIGVEMPFLEWQEPVPQTFDEFAKRLVEVYKRAYGIPDMRVERVIVGERESMAIFPFSEVCADVFVPWSERYDVVYRFVLLRPLCTPEGAELVEVGQRILENIHFDLSPQTN